MSELVSNFLGLGKAKKRVKKGLRKNQFSPEKILSEKDEPHIIERDGTVSGVNSGHNYKSKRGRKEKGEKEGGGFLSSIGDLLTGSKSNEDENTPGEGVQREQTIEGVTVTATKPHYKDDYRPSKNLLLYGGIAIAVIIVIYLVMKKK